MFPGLFPELTIVCIFLHRAIPVNISRLLGRLYGCQHYGKVLFVRDGFTATNGVGQLN